MVFHLRWSSLLVVAASVAIVQPAVAQVTQINQVQINTVNGALEVRLAITNGTTPQAFTNRYGETVIIDLTNTQLNLPMGDRLIENNPAEGVTAIQVAPLDANSVRITIIGQQQAPTVMLTPSNGAVVVSVAPSDAIADQLPDAPTPDEDIPAPEVPSESGEGLRIVVTDESEESPYLAPEANAGTRTDASIFEVPQSIQVLPQQLLEDQQVIRLDNALENVPNVVRDNSAGNNGDAFAIRGFQRPTILRDGFRTAGALEVVNRFEETANVEQIEVLSGPASILYGNVEPGGVINLVTEQPLPEFFGEVGLQLGSFELFRPTLDVSGPLTDDGDLLYRLNVAYEYGDGFRDFETNVERVFVAPVLQWQIGDRTSLTFELDYLDDERPFDRGIPAIGDEVADVSLETITGNFDDFSETEVFNVGYRLEHEFSDNWRLRNRFRYSNSDFLTRRAEISPPSSGVNEVTGDINRVFVSNDNLLESFEAQTELTGEFSTGSIEHTVLLALDLSFSNSDLLTNVALAPPVNLFDRGSDDLASPDLPLPFTVLDVESEIDRVGLVLQDQIRLLPDLTVLLGGRLDFISLRSESAPTSVPGLSSTPGSDDEQDFSNFSPRLGIVYQPIEPLFLYASYSQSFSPNDLSAITVDGDFLDPQEAEQFEVGVKAELIEGRLVATLSFFDITLENVPATDPDNPEFVVPIGQQSSRGLELVLQGEILPGWNIVASYGLLDAEIEESADFPDGAVPLNVADNTASLFTTYEIQEGALEGLGFGLGLFFVDDRPGDNENTFELDSYLRTDASLFYRTEQVRLGLNFRNVFDVDYFERAADRRGALPGDPFSVIFSIALTF